MKTLENVVVLSLEDYEQLMKNQKSNDLTVDYSKLKIGSVVKIKYTGHQIQAECDENKNCIIFGIDNGYVTNRLGGLHKVESKKTLNVIQIGGRISSFASDSNHDYIKEVISY